MNKYTEELTKYLDREPLERLLMACEDIRTMRVRGAGKIARYAARTLKETCLNVRCNSSTDYINAVKKIARCLVNTRPTAVSLPNSMRFILNRLFEDYKSGIDDIDTLKDLTAKYSDSFIKNSLDAVKTIAELGSRRIRDGDIIMTHCHSTVAVKILQKAWDSGKHIEVFVRETRPRYQGHITAKALASAGIPVTLIVDSAARYFMKDVDLVVIGADTVAVNGAVINKIGTSELALVAKESRVNVMVGAETYKFDPKTVSGELVKIEERDWREVINEEKLKVIGNIKVRNPAFDVTPPQYIDIIVTERGVIPPQAAFLIIQSEFKISLPHIRDPWE